MSNKCKAYSYSKLGLEPADNKKAFYAGWDAAKEALAQPEPVAISDTSEKRVDETAKQRHEPEPVAKVIDWGIEGPRLKGLTEDWPRVGTLLYACPKQRTWQGLTDEERNDCLVDADPCECLATPEAEELMRCIEAKLKEKNT